MRRSRKHTDIGILGVKSHSYRTTVNASTCAIRETSYRLDLCKVEVSKLLSVGGNNCDTNEKSYCGSKTIGSKELKDSTAASGCNIPTRFTIRCMQRLKLHATISEAHRHRNPRREIAFLPYNRQREHMRHSRNFCPLTFMSNRGGKLLSAEERIADVAGIA